MVYAKKTDNQATCLKKKCKRNVRPNICVLCDTMVRIVFVFRISSFFIFLLGSGYSIQVPSEPPPARLFSVYFQRYI